jgi:hypothetical protein
MAGVSLHIPNLGWRHSFLIPYLNFKKEHILVDGMNADGIENGRKFSPGPKRSRLHSGSKSSVSSEEIKREKKIRGKRVIYIYPINR